MATKTFPEGMHLAVTVNFRSDGAAFPPSTVDYTLRNVTHDSTVIDWTSVTPSDEVEITIPAGSVDILDDGNKKELQELTVVANRGLDTQVPVTTRWYVKNLKAL